METTENTVPDTRTEAESQSVKLGEVVFYLLLHHWPRLTNSDTGAYEQAMSDGLPCIKVPVQLGAKEAGMLKEALGSPLIAGSRVALIGIEVKDGSGYSYPFMFPIRP